MSDGRAALVEKLRGLGVTDLVVWGLKSNTHTHHYIHRGVYDCLADLATLARARVHWYDDQPVRLSRKTWKGRLRTYLFFASPHFDLDNNIPILPDAYYILHADWSHSWSKRQPIIRYTDHAAAGKAVYWGVFRGFPGQGWSTIDQRELAYHNPAEHRLVMPWATDLLPDRTYSVIDAIRDRYQARRLFPGDKVLFVGSVWQRNEQVMERFERACARHGLRLSLERIESVADNVAAAQDTYMAPAIQGEGHITSQDQFYVPCRILKNISYGALGVTNNAGVSDLFEGRLVYSSHEDDLLDQYADQVATFSRGSLAEMIELIEAVRDRHTYLNRLNHCLDQLR